MMYIPRPSKSCIISAVSEETAFCLCERKFPFLDFYGCFFDFNIFMAICQFNPLIIPFAPVHSMHPGAFSMEPELKIFFAL